MKPFVALVQKIQKKRAIIGVVGIGYVGSALGLAAAAAGFNVIGFGKTKVNIDKINNLKHKRFFATHRMSELAKCDIICICVPTPIYKNKKPDLRALRSATGNVARFLRAGQLITIESSVAPGTTKNIVLPLLLSSHLGIEKDFFLAFSPERVDPGNKQYRFTNIPKVVAGVGPYSKKLAVKFYERIVQKVVPVSNLETAEMVKMLENTFRFINISFINELTNYTNILNIDMWEVVNAAATKPFGFLAHYPGPGVGGHCIAVDPYYILHDAKKRGIKLNMIREAGKLNDLQPARVVERALEILKKKGTKKGAKKKILLIGVTYKPNVSDTRESAALHIWSLLHKYGHTISYHDPYIPQINGSSSQLLSKELIEKNDLVIIATHHGSINYHAILESNTPILDTRNVFNKHNVPHVFRV